MKKLFTLLTMLLVGIGGLWGQYLDRTGWSALASSACDDGNTGQISAILDGSTTTWWHSNYGGSHSYGISKGVCPHAFQLDLGSEKSFYGVQIQNRTDNDGNGRVKGYEIYVSNEPFTSSTTGFDASTVKSGKTPALTGTFSDSSKGAINIAIGTTLLTGRYVLFVITSSYNQDGNPEYAAIAEVNLLSVYVPSGYNSYTGENKAITSDLWKTQSNWVHKDNWDSNGPGCSNSNMWSPIYLKDITGGTVPALEGWNFRMVADHSKYTIENVGKIQYESGYNSYLTLKNTSVITMNFSTGHSYSWTVNLNEGTGNILNFVSAKDNYDNPITVNYGSVSKNTNRVFNASSSNKTITRLILNASLTEPTEKNTVESIPLATFTNTTVTTPDPNITGTEGWTLVDSEAALETQTTNGKYYYVEQNSTSGVTLHTYLRSIYEVSASTTETLSEITDYETYGQFVVPSGSTLNVDVAGFDLSKIGGAGTINVYEETVAQVTTAKTQITNITGTVNYFVTEKQTSNIVTNTDNITYTGGAGTSESRVSINHNGGSATLTGTGKTYYLTGSNSATQTTINFDETTVNYNNELGVGTATYNINNTNITTPRFITSQGADGRAAVVNLTGNTKITVSGYSHDEKNADSNKSAIMIGHWNGSSNVTLNGTAQIEATDAQLLIGLTHNTQTITLNESSNITAKGIKVSSNASGTNTLNLNGGSLNLGDVGITSYSSSRSIAVSVTENSTITATDYLLPISQPLTVASGKTLTIDGGESNAIVRLTGAVTKNGTIKFTNAAIEGGDARDCSTLSLPYTYENCTLVINETTDDFDEDNETITIKNIPDGFTSVRLRRADRRYVTLEVTDGSATFTDSEAKVSGPKCLYDFTFSKETLAERMIENSTWILNSGSRGSSNGLQYDWSFNSGNSYNEETGLLKAKSTPWRDMKDGNAWPVNYSVAVYANVPDVENGCLMAFGSSAHGGNKYLALLRGATSNEIKLVKGNGKNSAFEVIATMSAENATVAKHLIIFTKDGSTFKVYCDGVNVATTTYDQTLGTGFQIGSVHGGVDGTGIVRINDDIVTSDVRDAVEVQSIRIFEGVLTDDQMSALMKEFPYVSKGGSYSRTISADANLGEDNSWAKKDDENTYHIPTPVVEEEATYYPDVTVTTSEDATLTVNENATFGKTTFGGSGTLTIAANEGHSLNIGGAVIINSNVVVKFGAIDMSTSPVTKGADAKLTFDFSDFNFNKVYATTTYTLTGVISQDDTHITAAGLPSSDDNRQYAFAFDDNHYKLIITVRAPQTVYLPSGTTEIEDDMAVKLTADAETNNGVLIQGDELVISETVAITCSQSVGFCSINIPEGVTMTVSNTGAQKATTITGDGTLNISMTDVEITTALNGTASCTLIDVSSDDQIAVGALKIRNDEKCTIGDYNYYISQDGTTKDVVLIKHYTRNVTSGRFGSICIENAALVSQMTGIEKVLKVTSVETDRVVMDEVEEMTAGVPYIFKSNADAINLTLKGENADEPVDDPEGYLVGNFAVADVPNSTSSQINYILQSNQFKKVTSETIKSGKNRCYLKVAGESSRMSTLGIAVDEDAPTGIDAINALMNNNAEIYDLNGRKLNDLRKGINIVNGVKVIVK